MTDDQTAQSAPAPEPQQGSPYSPEDIRLAQADETAAFQEATISYLQNRVTTLNLEVRVRDRRLAELEARVVELERELEPEPAPEPRPDKSGA